MAASTPAVAPASPTGVYAKYIGRVGVLAVALGFGMAVATGQGVGVAWADDDPGTNANTNEAPPSDGPPSDSTPSGAGDQDPGTIASAGVDEPDTDPSDDGAELDTEVDLDSSVEPLTAGDDDGPIVEIDEGLDSDGLNPQPDAATGESNILADHHNSVTAPSDAASHEQPSILVREDSSTDPAPNADAPATGRLMFAPEGGTESLGSFAAGPTQTDFTTLDETVPTQHAAMGLPGAVVSVATTLIGVFLSPFLATGPDAPAEPPLLWAMLAFVRREFSRTFFNTTPHAVADPVTTSEDTPEVIDVLSNDVDDNSLTITDFTQPENGTVELNDDGTFTYTPDENFSGTDTFSYTVSDASAGTHLHGIFGIFGRGHTDSATVTVTVDPVNDAPVANNDTAGVDGGGTVTIPVAANDTDVDGTLDLTSLVVTGQPTNGAVTVNADGTITYQSYNAEVSPDSFSYTIGDNDGATSNVATVSINVVNQPPEASANPVELTVNDVSGVVSGKVKVTDPNNDKLVYDLATDIDPAVGTVTVNSTTGEFAYVPNPEFRRSAFATPDEETVTFDVVVTDGRASTTVEVTAPVSALEAHPDDDGTLDPDDLLGLVADGTVDVVQNDDGTVRVIDGTFTDDIVRNSTDAAAAFNRIAALLGGAAGFAEDANITVQRVDQAAADGEVSEAFYRLGQVVDGIPVVGSEAVLVTDGNGTVIGVFSAYDGQISDVDTTAADTVDQPSEAEAVATAALLSDWNELDDETRDALLASLVYDTDLIIYAPDPDIPPRLIWKVDVSTPTPDDQDPEADDAPTSQLPDISTRYYVYANGVEAGQILESKSYLEGLHALVSTTDRATDARGVQRIINVQRAGNIYVLVDGPRNIKTYENSVGNFVKKGFFGWDQSAVSAHANMEDVYDYYKKVLGAKTFDFADRYGLGNGIKVVLLGDGYKQASWDLRTARFTFGDDIERGKDVVAHEFTHAVISDIVGRGYTYGLDGNKESLALNEAYADILGNLIERKVGAGEWTIAEDYRHCSSTPTCGRDMSAPLRRTYTSIQSGDDVHEMVGPFELAAYKMMTQTSGISKEKWATVFYRSVQRLSFGAKFQDAANAVVSSARSQGFTPDQIATIRQAFADTGLQTSRGYVPPTVNVPSPEVISSISLTDAPLNLTVSKDGRYVYVNSYKIVMSPDGSVPAGYRAMVTQIDVATGATHTDTIFESDTTSNVQHPFGLAASPDGRYVYVLSGQTTNIALPATVTVLDTTTHAVVGDPIAVGTYPIGRLFISPDGSRVYVTTQEISATSPGIPQGKVSVINTSTRTVTQQIPVGYVQDVAMSPDGTRLFPVTMDFDATGKIRYVIKVVNTANSGVVRTIPVSDYRAVDQGFVLVADMVSSTDGRRLYAMVIDTAQNSYTYSVDVYDSVTGQRVDRYDDVGQAFGNLAQKGHFIALSPDGRYLYTRDSAEQSIKVIDTRTGDFVGDPVVTQINDMVLSPDGKTLYATGADSTFDPTLFVYSLD